MRITDVVWKERTVEKLSERHGVSAVEAARDMSPSERSYYDKHE